MPKVPPIDRFNFENEWHEYLKKHNQNEKAYYFFSLRMVVYALSSVFMTLFFVFKISKGMTFYDQVLSGFYIASVLLVFAMVFFDVNRFKGNRAA